MILLPHSPPRTVDEVLADLVALQRTELSPSDGVRYFNRLYIGVTTGIRGVLADGGAEDPAFLIALTIAFAQAYFDALIRGEAGAAAAPPAWQPVLEARTDRRVAPIQLALAGLNAHVNYDLPVQLTATSARRGVMLDVDTPQHRDFERLASVFGRVEEQGKQWLLSGLLARLDRLLGHVDDTVAIWSLLRARDAAWSNAITLWHLRDDEARATHFRDTLGHVTGAFGRGLTLPAVPGIERSLHRLLAS